MDPFPRYRVPIVREFKSERAARKMLGLLHDIPAAQFADEPEGFRRVYDLVSGVQIERTKTGKWRIEIISFLVEREGHRLPTGHA